jgi:hypothetical protein
MKPISGCTAPEGVFSSFGQGEILPMRLVTTCKLKYTKVCSEESCPRFRHGVQSFGKQSWRTTKKEF